MNFMISRTKDSLLPAADFVDAKRWPRKPRKYPRYSLLAGELGHIGVKIHAIDAFEFQNDIFALEFCDGGSDLIGGVRLVLVRPLWANHRLTAIFRFSLQRKPRYPAGALFNPLHLAWSEAPPR